MRIFIYLCSLLMCAAMLVSCQSRQRSSADEEYAVLSAYLGAQINSNPHDFGSGRGVVLIQESTWTMPDELVSRPAHLKEKLKHLDQSTLDDFVRANETSITLQRRFSLPTKYMIASEVNIRDRTVKGSYGYLVLSRVGFSDDGSQALFHIDHYCGLCGGSGYILMQKNILGQWKVKDEYFPIVF